jgi:hypothetical protein
LPSAERTPCEGTLFYCCSNSLPVVCVLCAHLFLPSFCLRPRHRRCLRVAHLDELEAHSRTCFLRRASAHMHTRRCPQAACASLSHIALAPATRERCRHTSEGAQPDERVPCGERNGYDGCVAAVYATCKAALALDARRAPARPRMRGRVSPDCAMQF